MEKTSFDTFILGTERLTKPTDVSTIATFSTLNSALPVSLQKKFMRASSATAPYMGFVVEPYSVFLCYPLIDHERAQQLIPDTYRLIPTAIFADEKPDYYIIFGAVTAHTSAFWGSRIEMYVIAEHKTTGLLSWIIVDYDTNTNSYDPRHGLVGRNCTNGVLTTSFEGRWYADMPRDDHSRRLTAQADITAGTMAALDQRLWLEGNIAIDYGRAFADAETQPFSLLFHPEEVQQALRIPLNAVNIQEHSWHAGLYAAQPAVVACFPFAQHFLTDSYPEQQTILNVKELKPRIDALGNFRSVHGFSANVIWRQVRIGVFISTLFSFSLLSWIILHMSIGH